MEFSLELSWNEFCLLLAADDGWLLPPRLSNETSDEEEKDELKLLPEDEHVDEDDEA